MVNAKPAPCLDKNQKGADPGAATNRWQIPAAPVFAGRLLC
jgi:hypothetical protein